MGANCKTFVDFCMVSSQYGFCIAYLIFIGSQLDQVICIASENEVCGNKNTYISLSVLILIPICCLKTFKYLSYISFLSNISIVLALMVIMFYDEQEYMYEPQYHQNLQTFNILHMPVFFGLAVFNFEGNGVILNVKASMKEPE
jgi:proton-coupled amino acid transporter